MSVGRICVREVYATDINESVQNAARRMRERNVGTLVVLNDDKEPIGMLTDRDLAINVLAQGEDPSCTKVGQIMIQCPETVDEETPIEEALHRMRSGSFRRLPVVNQVGRLVGLLTLDDILDLLCEEFREIGELIGKQGPTRFRG